MNDGSPRQSREVSSALAHSHIGSIALPLVLLSCLLLAACGGGGGDSSSPPASPLPTVTFSASPTSVTSGSAATLTWSSTGATSCAASGAWSGAIATTGSQSTGALITGAQATQSQFTLTCNGPGGSAMQSINVDVLPMVSPTPTVAITANPMSVVSGTMSVLTWSSTNATSCSASGGWTGPVATSGTQNTSALTSAATYTLTCVGAGGSANASVTVSVLPIPTAVITANPTSVVSGSASTLTWSSTNASTCVASGAWTGSKAISGSQSTGALTNSSTFTLTCTGTGGSANASVTVTISTGSANVSWVAPTTNADGTPLFDLSGFRVYYGTSPGNYSSFVDVPSSSATSRTINNLSAGTYYFAVSAFDTTGNESALSAEMSKAL